LLYLKKLTAETGFLFLKPTPNPETARNPVSFLDPDPKFYALIYVSDHVKIGVNT
jgi:hypothetical protein